MERIPSLKYLEFAVRIGMKMFYFRPPSLELFQYSVEGSSKRAVVLHFYATNNFLSLVKLEIHDFAKFGRWVKPKLQARNGLGLLLLWSRTDLVLHLILVFLLLPVIIKINKFSKPECKLSLIFNCLKDELILDNAWKCLAIWCLKIVANAWQCLACNHIWRSWNEISFIVCYQNFWYGIYSPFRLGQSLKLLKLNMESSKTLENCLKLALIRKFSWGS